MNNFDGTVRRVGLAVGALALAGLWASSGCSTVVRTFGSGTGGGDSSSSATGATECKAGEKQACYDGPAGTETNGICHGGMATCGADGKLGACEGEQVPKTKIDCSLHQDQDCDGVTDRCPLDFLWGDVFPATMGEDSEVKSVAADATGDVILVGTLNGKVDFGTGAVGPVNGDEDVFVVKLDPMGKLLWSQTYGDTVNSQEGLAVAVDTKGNVYAGGDYAGDMTVGSVALPTSIGGEDAFVIKLDPTGALLWQRTGGNANDQQIQALTATPSGGVIVVGTTDDSFNFSNSGPTLNGTSGSTTTFIQAFDAMGTPVFHATTLVTNGTSGYQQVGGVAMTPMGNVVIAGSFTNQMTFPDGSSAISAGGADVWVMELNGQTGTVLWKQTFGSAMDEAVNGVSTDSKGDVVLSGTFSTAVTIGSDALTTTGVVGMYLTLLDGSTGAPTWAKGYGAGMGFDSMFVHVDGQDNIIVGGYFDGTLNLGGTTLDADEGTQMFGAATYLGKLDPSGAHIASKAFGTGMGIAATFGVTTVPKTNVVVMVGATTFPIDLGSGMPMGPAAMVASPFAAEYSP